MLLRKCFSTLAMGMGLSSSMAAFAPVIYAQVGTGAAPDAASDSGRTPGNPGSGAATSPMGGSVGSSNGTAVDSDANANANIPTSPAGPPADPTTVRCPKTHQAAGKSSYAGRKAR